MEDVSEVWRLGGLCMYGKGREDLQGERIEDSEEDEGKEGDELRHGGCLVSVV